MDQMIDMSNTTAKSEFINSVRGLQGIYRVEIVKYRKRRSLVQNRLYWRNYATPFMEYLNDQGAAITKDDAHEILKARFLAASKTIIDKNGEEKIVRYVRSSRTLDTAEFSLAFLEKVEYFLGDFCGFKNLMPAGQILKDGQ